MRLDRATWYEVAAYLRRARGIFLPVGSTEQHGPIGLIGTDAICAQRIAETAADLTQSYVAPTLAYTPAPFNALFPGTISLSAPVFQAMAQEVLGALYAQGFERIYILNGHGANLDPLRAAHHAVPDDALRLRSWWDFEPVTALRHQYYGAWEGMHATPSEVAITQVDGRIIQHPDADRAPQKLSAAFIAAHAGDKHGPPDDHRAAFPDGRVGSHSALARPDHGAALLQAAAEAVARDFRDFVQ